MRSDGQHLNQELPDHVTQLDDGSLSFRTVESGDAGNYTCYATNDQGPISATVRVDIVGRYSILSLYLLNRPIQRILITFSRPQRQETAFKLAESINIYLRQI